MKDKGKIKSNTEGIYRYLDEKGEIIYIGKGNIKTRLNEVGRDKWEIKFIEYSIIKNEDEQFLWEDFWIEKFKKSNSNFLPVFNRISGRKK